MIWLLPVAVVGVGLLLLGLRILWADDLNGFGMFCCVVGAIVLAGCIMTTAIVYGSRAVGRTTCRHWAEQTGVRTKFVILNWSDTGTCLARTPSGLWVKNSQWTAFLQGFRR